MQAAWLQTPALFGHWVGGDTRGQLWVPGAGGCLFCGCCWGGCNEREVPWPLSRLCPVLPLPGPVLTLPALGQVQDGRPVSFPSLLSHLTSMHLNAEALVLPMAQEKPSPPAVRSFLPLSTTLPCDFHILNLRTLQAEVSCARGQGGHGLGQEDSGLTPAVLSVTAHSLSPGRTTRCPRPRQP